MNATETSIDFVKKKNIIEVVFRKRMSKKMFNEVIYTCMFMYLKIFGLM